MEEIWKDIPGFEAYQVSNLGKVKSIKRGKILSYGLRRGYPSVLLHRQGERKNYTIHRLVATLFIANPENKPQINHKNGIRIDNRADNLEWCTCSENIYHAYKTLNKQAPAKGVSKLNFKSSNAKKVICITTNESFTSASEAARVYGLNHSKISAVCRGDRKSTNKMIFKYA